VQDANDRIDQLLTDVIDGLALFECVGRFGHFGVDEREHLPDARLIRRKTLRIRHCPHLQHLLIQSDWLNHRGSFIRNIIYHNV
jgi:hypothetical protein